MIKVLETAIEKMKSLPSERQAYAAHVLEQIAATTTTPFTVPDEHCRAVLEGLKEADNGELASDQEMAALWRKCAV